jgi:plastocyanin
MRKLLSGLLKPTLVLILALGVAACGGDDDDDAANPEDTGGDTIEVTISGSAFDPSAVDAAAGDATFAVTNDDSFQHTFTSEDLDIDEALDGGSDTTVTATLEPGTYAFHCKIHPSMTGEITVT